MWGNLGGAERSLGRVVTRGAIGETKGYGGSEGYIRAVSLARMSVNVVCAAANVQFISW